MSKTASKALLAIPEPYYTALKKAILHLETEPRPQGCKKLKGREAYRIRVGNYRVIYEIKDLQLLVYVLDLGHRQGIYG